MKKYYFLCRVVLVQKAAFVFYLYGVFSTKYIYKFVALVVTCKKDWFYFVSLCHKGSKHFRFLIKMTQKSGYRRVRLLSSGCQKVCSTILKPIRRAIVDDVLISLRRRYSFIVRQVAARLLTRPARAADSGRLLAAKFYGAHRVQREIPRW